MPADSRDMVLVPRSWLKSFDREANPNEAIADNGGSVWDFFCHEAEQFLSASPARGEGDAPVAWRARLVDPVSSVKTVWNLHHSEPDRESPDSRVCVEVEPLFTHPTPATPAGEELRTALLRARYHVENSPHSGREEVLAMIDAALSPETDQ